MVDAQFREDRYEENEDRDRAAAAEASLRAAEREKLKPKKLTRAERMTSRAEMIQMASKKAQNTNTIVLKELSKYTPGGQEISVVVKRMTPQELLAGDLLPTTARKVVSYFTQVGNDAVQNENVRLGIQSMSPDEVGQAVVEDAFDGDEMEAFTAYVQLINAVCIACVRDPDIHLYLNEREKGNDVLGMVIDSIPFPDREAIANWAMRQEEVAAESVRPFLGRSDDALHPVPEVERGEGASVRPDSV